MLEEIKSKQPIDEIIQTVHSIINLLLLFLDLGEKTLTFNIWNMEDFDYKGILINYNM